MLEAQLIGNFTYGKARSGELFLRFFYKFMVYMLLCILAGEGTQHVA